MPKENKSLIQNVKNKKSKMFKIAREGDIKG